MTDIVHLKRFKAKRTEEEQKTWEDFHKGGILPQNDEHLRMMMMGDTRFRNPVNRAERRKQDRFFKGGGPGFTQPTKAKRKHDRERREDSA